MSGTLSANGEYSTAPVMVHSYYDDFPFTLFLGYGILGAGRPDLGLLHTAITPISCMLLSIQKRRLQRHFPGEGDKIGF